MKKFIFCLLASMLCFNAALAQGAKTRTTRSAPPTVTDFFLRLPEKYSPVPGSVKRKKEFIEIEDARNGYLRLAKNDWEGWAEIALFKKKRGGYLVAVVAYGCGPVCDGNEIFLNYDNGKWSEASSVLPRFTFGEMSDIFKRKTKREPEEEDTVIYELPRKGRDIAVRMGETIVYYLSWDGAKFVGGPAE